MEKTLARSELERMGESISNRRFKDICVQGFTPEYKDIKLMMYRDPTFDIDQMQTTMRHLCLDDLSRSSGAGKVAGRGMAVSRDVHLQSLREGRSSRSELLEEEERDQPGPKQEILRKAGRIKGRRRWAVVVLYSQDCFSQPREVLRPRWPASRPRSCQSRLFRSHCWLCSN